MKNNKKVFAIIICILAMLNSSCSKKSEQEKHNFTIGIWGCNQYGFGKPAIKKYIELNPDLMLYIGDNVYVDKADSITYSEVLKNFIIDSLSSNQDSFNSIIDYENKFNNWLLKKEKYKYFDFNNNGEIDKSKETHKNEQRFVNSYFDLILYGYNKTEKHCFMNLKNSFEYMTTWDDHDFGINNGQGELPEGSLIKSAGKVRDVGWQKGKVMGRQIHTNFWDIQNNLPSKTGGVYYSKILQPSKNRNLQIIMLDNRWYQKYSTDTSNCTLLGEEQLRWFLNELNKKADIRIIVSGTHIISDDKSMESWETYRHERNKIFKTIESQNIKNIFFLSGDKHVGAVSYLEAGSKNINNNGYNLFNNSDYYEFHFCGINETEFLDKKGYFNEDAGNTNEIAWGDREDILNHANKMVIAGDKYSYISITNDSLSFKVLAIKQNKPFSKKEFIADDKELVSITVFH